MTDCLAQHAKFFPKGELQSLRDAIRAHVAEGLSDKQAQTEAVQAALDEAHTDMEDIREAIAEALKPKPETAAIQNAVEAMRTTADAMREMAQPKQESAAKQLYNSPSRKFLRLVASLGGIKSSDALDVVGEKSAMKLGGMAARVFKKGGVGIDLMATKLHERHWLTDDEYEDVDGGVQRVKDMLRDAVSDNLEPVLEDDVQAEMERDHLRRELADETASQIPEKWNTISDEAHAYELDRIFGEDTNPAASAAESAPSLRPEGLELTGQSEGEIRADEAKRAAESAKQRQVENAPSPEGFKLTGSNRTADEAAAAGQADIPFSRSSQIETPEFKQWFGDSQVVDEDGEPQVVYHGTREDFSRFNLGKLGKNTIGEAGSPELEQTAMVGHWLSDHPMGESPEKYGAGYSIDLPVYLKMENPLVLAESDDLAVMLHKKKGRALRSELETRGYDGIIIRRDIEFGGRSYIAFHSTQIKSAVGNRGTFNANNPDILFQKGAAVTGMPAESVHAAVDPILARWKNGPKVVVLDSLDDPRAPEIFRTTDRIQRAQGAGGQVRGVAYKGTVYLIADQIRTPEAAQTVLFHEALGHYGLRGVYGDALKPILAEIGIGRRDDIARKIKQYGLNPASMSDRLTAAEEVLAELAEKNPQLGIVRRAIAAIRNWLRAHGVDLKLSDDDIVQKYLLPARRFVEGGKSGTDTPAFSRGEPEAPTRLSVVSNASDAFDKAKGSFTERLTKAKKQGYIATARAVVDRIDQALNPLGTLPEQEKFLIQRGLAQGLIEKADDSAKGIRDAFPNATPEDKQAIFDYLTTAGATPDAIHDAGHQAQAVGIKGQINLIGDELVSHGLLSPDAREQYKDAYLPRLYLKHLLSENDWKALGAGKKPSDMGYLKKRKDIPEEVRKVILGEITDPGFLAAMAIAKPARDMALIDWLDQISQNEKWILPGSLVPFTSPLTGRTTQSTPFWLKEEAAQLRKRARYYAPEDATKAEEEAKAMDAAADDAIEGIQGEHSDFKQIPSSARYGRLRGMFVRTEIYNDLMGINDFLPTDPGWFQNVFGYGGVGTRATQVWKGMKVAMNPPAQVRNFVSNAVAMQLFAGVPLRILPTRIYQAIKEIRGEGVHFLVGKKHGAGVSTFAAQEVFRMKTELLDLEAKTKGLGALGQMHRIAALLMNKSSDMYQLSETIFKTAVIIDGMERQGLTEEDAVHLAQNALFDYSLIQKSARYARSAPIGIPFLTYQLKVLPRLIETALLHPQRFLPWVALFYGFPMLVASMLGVDKDDLDRLKMAMPDWLQDKGHALILPYKDDNGRWQVVDMGYFVPWSNWTQLAGNVFEGDAGKAIQTAGIFSGPITDMIVAIRTGTDPFTNKPIWAAGDPPEKQMASIMNYIWDMGAPPFLTDHGLLSPMGLLDTAYGGKAVQALTGTTDKFGSPRATAEQAALYLAGININAITPENTREQNVKTMTRGLQDVKTQMRYKLEDQSLSVDQRKDLAAQYAQEIVRRTSKLQQYLKDSVISPALATR